MHDTPTAGHARQPTAVGVESTISSRTSGPVMATWAPLQTLSEAECLRLLTDKPMGRVAFWDSEGPHVLPVNHAVFQGDVVFRVAAHTQLARGLRDGTVAFEVDDIEDVTQSGWSVLVVGRPEYVEDPVAMSEIWGRRLPDAWAPGSRTLVIRIATQKISGRRIRPA